MGLCHLLASARVSIEPPPWLREGDGVRTQPAAYLILDAARVVLPLVDRDGQLIATTALMPGMVEGKRREQRNERAGNLRAGKRARRLAISDHPGTRRPPPDADEWA